MAILTTVKMRRASRKTTYKGKVYQKGQFLPRAARSGKLESYTQRRTDMGRIIAALEVTTEKTITKTITPEMIEKAQGLLWVAVSLSNITSKKTTEGAKSIEIRIKGKDLRDKLHRFAISIDLEKKKGIGPLMFGRLIEKLHEQRFRTQYDLNKVDWSEAKTTKAYSKSMRQLKDIQIIIKVRK